MVVNGKVTCNTTATDVLEQVATIAARWRDRPDMIIPVLHEVQTIAGNGLPKDVVDVVSREMRVPLSEIYGVETFYSFFSTQKRGKTVIRLCKSAPCHVKGSKKVLEAFEKVLGIKAGETTEDGDFTLETCECIGACDVSPAALIDGVVYGDLTPEKVEKLITTLRKKE